MKYKKWHAILSLFFVVVNDQTANGYLWEEDIDHVCYLFFKLLHGNVTNTNYLVMSTK